MEKIKVCVVGYGNVGREAVECVKQAPDMELAGVVEVMDVKNPPVPVVKQVDELGQVDVAVLTIPSRLVPKIAPSYLEKGISTVDAFDIHGDAMLSLKKQLDESAKQYGQVSIIGAGWDPGTDSVVRMLFTAMAPIGITYTNYGPGMSMGHSVAAKAIPGVVDAVSLTLPVGFGQHHRDVYVQIEDDADFEKIAAAIKSDPYFVNDVTRVTKIEDVNEAKVMGHGVHLERLGGAGSAQNQMLQLEMRLSNPSATSQMMVAAARAATRLNPGGYVLPEVPPIDLVPGEKDKLIKTLV